MELLCLPANQLFSYALTGKFKAPSTEWQHMHMELNDYELFVMTEGVLYIRHGQDNFTVKSGEYLLLPPNGSWRQGVKPAYSSFYWLHFTTVPGGLPPVLTPGTPLSPPEEYFAIPQTGTIPHLDKIVVLMKQLQDIVKSNYPAIALNAMTTSILTALYGQLSLQSSSPETVPEGQKQVYLDILDYVKNNISHPLKVSEIAAAFGYNEKYLSHRFSQVFGMPLKQYILKAKVEQANFMLTDTNHSISDIAKTLGFSDSHNFSRTYKKLTGLSPSEYRNTFSKRLLYHV